MLPTRKLTLLLWGAAATQKSATQQVWQLQILLVECLCKQINKQTIEQALPCWILVHTVVG